MKTTIETINGNPYTVIWHLQKDWRLRTGEFESVESLEKRMADGLSRTVTHKTAGSWVEDNYHYLKCPITQAIHCLPIGNNNTIFATALPALQRTQTTENSWLLRLYTLYDFNIYLLGSWKAADGYDVPLKEPENFVGIDSDEYDHHWITSTSTLVWGVELSHVSNKSGERVSVAIKGE